MRLLRPLFVILVASACAVDPADRPIDDDGDPDPPAFDHICDAMKYEAAQADDAWTPGELDRCFEGCDDGEAAGYDQGRLVCLTSGVPCPECVADQDGRGYDAGYKACFASSYREGYADEGCTEA